MFLRLTLAWPTITRRETTRNIVALIDSSLYCCSCLLRDAAIAIPLITCRNARSFDPPRVYVTLLSVSYRSGKYRKIPIYG